ncbi:unnamed protein product, partial [Meganyctiphanes norvegica]
STVNTLTRITMDQHSGLLRHFAVVLALLTATALQNTDASNTCYYCTDDPNDRPYDAECSKYDYQGHTEDWYGYHGCSITIYDDNGYIYRGFDNENEDGNCRYGPSYTICYCTGSNCNTGSYCAQCGYPRPTPGLTTEDTTVTTTQQLPHTTEDTTVTMTQQPPHTTANTTPISTATPVTLKCFQCNPCGHVDDNTLVTEDEYLSCVTTMDLESAEVIRGGSYKGHSDGQCAQNSETVSCWCSSDLCNNSIIEL